jgi:hypothetical protein
LHLDEQSLINFLLSAHSFLVLTTPDSPKRLQRQHTHKRHATPAPAHTTPAHFDFLRTACAPTSTHSNGFVSYGFVLVQVQAPSSSAPNCLAFRSTFFRSLRVAVSLEFGFNASIICLFPGNEIQFRREFRCGGLIWKGLSSNMHPRHWVLFHTGLYSLEFKFELWSTQLATNALPHCPHYKCSQTITTITITTLPSP